MRQLWQRSGRERREEGDERGAASHISASRKYRKMQNGEEEKLPTLWRPERKNKKVLTQIHERIFKKSPGLKKSVLQLSFPHTRSEREKTGPGANYSIFSSSSSDCTFRPPPLLTRAERRKETTTALLSAGGAGEEVEFHLLHFVSPVHEKEGKI